MAVNRERDVLAKTVKSVHQKLRREFKLSGNVDHLWEKHLEDEDTLNEYAQAMHRLATQHWTNLTDADPKTSRINWTRNIVVQYFWEGGIEKERQKRGPNTNPSTLNWLDNNKRKIQVLDVGSCYNPFSEYQDFDVLAVDLCPAVESVYVCDFLNVIIKECGGASQLLEREVRSLEASSFDVVIFSLLLEYLPSSSQRWKCCKNASDLLQDEGLLVIITPDSKAAHANAQVMKSWRSALVLLGLKRISYEKLTHTHCMAFRKISSHSLTPAEEEMAIPKMYIPQDLREVAIPDDGDSQPAISFTEEELLEGFSILPQFEDSCE